MTVDLPFLLLGIALLWFPRHWMRRGVALMRRRRRSAESERIVEPWKDREPGDPRVDFRVEFVKFRNYLDLFRGMAGSLVIWGGVEVAPAIAVEPGAAKALLYQVLALRCAITLVGLLIQAVRFERNRVSFYPPIFYLSGVSVGLCGYRAAAFAFVMIWAINIGVANAQVFLTFHAVLMVLFGLLFSRSAWVSVVVAGVITFLPVLLSLLAQRPLVIFTRKGSRTPRPA